MELKESKKKVTQCSHVGSRFWKVNSGFNQISMNQVILQGFQIHIVNEFLKSLGTELNVEFDGNYAHYNDLIMDIAEEIDGKCEYLLAYDQNKKGYNTFKINEIFDI